MQKGIDRRILEYDDSHERLIPEESEKWLNRRIQNIVKYAYHNAPAVKSKLDNAGVSPADIRGIRDLEKVPVTTKDELVRSQRASPPFGGFLTVPLNSLETIYVSPGPIYDVWSPKCVVAFARHIYDELGARPGDIAIVNAAYHLVPAGLATTQSLNLLGITVVPAGTGQTELQVQIMHEVGVNGCCAFPSFLMTIINKAEEMGYNFRRDFKLRWAVISGERHVSLLRKSLEDNYGLATWQGYGSGDLGYVAFECREKNGMHFDNKRAFIEICDPQTGKRLGPGEKGEIVVSLFDRVYPLIRFGTGDLASYANEPCHCGRTTPRITEILGMVGEHIRLKGMFIHRREIHEAISKMPEVSKAQIVVTLRGHRDVMTARVELTGEGVDQNAFCQAFAKTCQDVFRLRPDNVELLPKGTLPEDYEIFVDRRWS